MSICKKTCGCGSHLNFGVKATVEFEAAIRLGFMDYINSDNEVNGLELDQVWDEAFWDAKTLNPNETKRLYLTPTADEATTAVADAPTQELQSGRVKSLGDGIVSYEFHFYDTDATFYNAIKSRKCKRDGVVMYDTCGSVAGHECTNDVLNVVEIAKNTLQVDYIPAVNRTSAAYTRVRFNLDINESPVFNIVQSADIEFSILNVESPYDVVAVGDVVGTQLQTVVVLEALTARVKDYIPAEGADTAVDWAITDSAGGTSAPTLVTESPAGTYTIDYASIAVGAAQFNFLDPNFKYEVNFESTIS